MDKQVVFVSDVHLGLAIADPQGREDRFVRFVRGLDRSKTAALYLLGDIWDFWYEYRDVIPRYGSRALASLLELMEDGVEIYFCSGNHDIWTYSYFESIGMHRFTQPFYTQIGEKRFCLGHGDTLGGAKWSYRFMLAVFRCRPIQWIFSLLHPWLAYRIGLSWSNSNRRSHKPYHFRGEEEPLYKYALEHQNEADYFIFGHFHDKVDMNLPSGARLLVVKDWMDGGEPCAVFDGKEVQQR